MHKNPGERNVAEYIRSVTFLGPTTIYSKQITINIFQMSTKQKRGLQGAGAFPQLVSAGSFPAILGSSALS